MNSVRINATAIMNRLIPSAPFCQLHRIYKISFPDGKKYVGQTKKIPEDRVREHARPSSKSIVHDAMVNHESFSVEVLAIAGSHNVDSMEKVAIALEKSLRVDDGLNVTIGGKGVKLPDERYEKFAEEVRHVASLMRSKRFVSWDELFVKNETTLTENEFKAIEHLVKSAKKPT